MEVTTAKQVRFSKIVETGGKPEAYLPFSDPEKDPAFMRAAREERVVTLKQEPTARHKDFGIVGYVKEKFATYLLFPKSLEAFSGQRVIGIDYGVLESADVRIGGKVSAVPKRSEPKKPKAKSAKPEPEPKPEPAKAEPKPPKKERPKQEPKRFIAEVVVTTIDRRQVEVSAWNTTEAKAKALQQVGEELPESTSVKVVKLRKQESGKP